MNLIKFLALYLSISTSLYAKPLTLNVSLNENNYYELSTTYLKKIEDKDFLEIVVLNQGDKPKEFYFVLEDDKSSGYFDSLVLKTQLFQGKNELRLNLNRSVGERGSSSNRRKLNLAKIKKAYMVFNPDKTTTSESIKIISINFLTEKALVTPAYIKAFDFNDENSTNGLIKVDSKTKYSKALGYGFETIDLWRTNNSKVPPKRLQYSLSVTNAVFSLDLVKDEYAFELIWDDLGYWEIPFWSKRVLKLNDEVIQLETRDLKAYLLDYFKFNQEDNSQLDIFSMLLDKVYQPVRFTRKHNGGKLSLKFSGDKSAVNLNSLFIYPVSKQEQFRKYKENLKKIESKEFNSYAREKKKVIKDQKTGLYIVSDNHLKLYHKCKDSEIKNISYGAKKDGVGIDICVEAPKSSQISLKVKSLTKKNKNLDTSDIVISRYQYKYKSIDLNHESYELRASYLIPAKQFETIEGRYYYHIQTPKMLLAQGEYTLEIELEINDQTLTKKIPFIIFADDTKRKVKLGLIGLNALGDNYFAQSGYKVTRDEVLNKAYGFLKDEGFDFFTELPALDIDYQKDNSSFKFNSRLVEHIPIRREQELFIYNQEGLRLLLEANDRNSAQSSKAYYKNLKSELELAQRDGHKLIYLYSDEASGYRNSVDYDLELLKKYQSLGLPLKYGGFGNLYDFKKASKLYQAWDYGFYSDIPESSLINKLKDLQEVGLYNQCLDPEADIRICYGLGLYLMEQAGVSYYLEWHVNAVNNYPGFDLDGREADIRFVKLDPQLRPLATRRLIQAKKGLNDYRLLKAFASYINKRKVLNQEELKLKKWYQNLTPKYPFSKNLNSQSQLVSNFYTQLNKILKLLKSRM
jgi:hypothetical protein